LFRLFIKLPGHHLVDLLNAEVHQQAESDDNANAEQPGLEGHGGQGRDFPSPAPDKAVRRQDNRAKNRGEDLIEVNDNPEPAQDTMLACLHIRINFSDIFIHRNGLGPLAFRQSVNINRAHKFISFLNAQIFVIFMQNLPNLFKITFNNFLQCFFIDFYILVFLVKIRLNYMDPFFAFVINLAG